MNFKNSQFSSLLDTSEGGHITKCSYELVLDDLLVNGLIDNFLDA